MTVIDCPNITCAKAPITPVLNTPLHTNFRFLGPFYKVLHRVVEEKAAFLSGLQEMEVAIMTTAIVMDTPTLFGPCQSVRPQKTD